ncbi:MAG: hypothetical protein COZ34_02745 [Candidatus Pacebacteria bacterium CG_4_10_14_3_um_filter_34_15]|nr:twin-arginine translocation signal domain-containing protein [Candidatus Paceibacterota bacterium]OIO45211.1 MAG: hypothetical protein AUJ41_00405 [Candidatus Pacebacteria bacterium CG1_02_43_31]PIQ81083.1 MAG: hypothetical protein COV78_02050 [Candidatus Pacebacteria bacterium CG11_big_fil_rev_8_21_14_0_20_34_55]PIX81567.1 MAG: hypothetical protein COZ34_02745 [Candidatus Pacebacteria bacterium CG_4_10_14_3_um_filter_34_15]PJC43954.1 MAG: hypothetical protein CO039_01515 [Candidatus Pacebac
MSEITRRDFLKLMGAAAGAVALNRFGLAKAEGQSNKPETAEQLLSRKEHFKPFNRGNAEWQYVEFQYSNTENERIGITTSISELTNPYTKEKTQQLLVMRHNLNTGETAKNVYEMVHILLMKLHLNTHLRIARINSWSSFPMMKVEIDIYSR